MSYREGKLRERTVENVLAPRAPLTKTAAAASE